MPQVDELLIRIDKEFSAVKDRIKENQSHQMDSYRGRQDGLAKFEQTLNRFCDVHVRRADSLAVLSLSTTAITVTSAISLLIGALLG